MELTCHPGLSIQLLWSVDMNFQSLGFTASVIVDIIMRYLIKKERRIQRHSSPFFPSFFRGQKPQEIRRSKKPVKP